MLKHKITSIIMGALMLSGVVLSGSVMHNVKTTNDNTKVVNKVLLSAPTSTNERAVVVNTENSPLVLYSSANSNSNITSYISVGEMLTIESSGDNFYKVKVQETGAVGYISANNLQIITSGVNDAYNTVNKQGYIINVSSVVNLRANATMNSNVLAKLTNNTKINVLGKQGQWYKVNCNGTIGYIYQEYVGLTNQIIDNSNRNISKPQVISNSNKNVSKSQVKVQKPNENKIVNITVPYGEKISLLAAPNSKKVVDTVTGINQVTIISSSNGWSYVKMHNINGYIETHLLNALINDYNKHINIDNTAKITVPYGEKISLLAAPNSKKVVDTITGINKITIINSSNGWSYININGIKGYIETHLLNALINDYNQNVSPNSVKN